MIATAVLACVVVVVANLLAYVLNENSLVWKLRCLPAPRLLFCSNRRLKRRPKLFWGFDTLDPDWLTTSYFVPVWLLATLRLLILLYVIAEILIERYTTPVGLGDPSYVWISFFTDWTFCVLGASGLLGFFVTLWRMMQRAKQQKRVRTQPDAESGNRISRLDGISGTDGASQRAAAAEVAATALPRAANDGAAAPHAVGASGGIAGSGSTTAAARKVTWTWYEAIYLLVFETSTTSTLFLTVFYWAALSGDGSTRADNIMKHGTNNILILLDVLLSRNPFLSYHFWVSLLYGTLYLIFMWAVWLPVEDYWVYTVFDWDHWRAIGAYAVLPLAVFIAFAIWTGVAALREVVGRRHPTLWSSALRPAKAAEVQLQPMPRQPEVLQQHAALSPPLPPPLQQQQRIPQNAGSLALQGGNSVAAQAGDAPPLSVRGAHFMAVTTRTPN